MKITKALFIISVFAAVVLLLIGIQLYCFNLSVTGFSFDKWGNKIEGTLNGFSAIFLSVFLMLFSLFTYRLYKRDKDNFDKMK